MSKRTLAVFELVVAIEMAFIALMPPHRWYDPLLVASCLYFTYQAVRHRRRSRPDE